MSSIKLNRWRCCRGKRRTRLPWNSKLIGGPQSNNDSRRSSNGRIRKTSCCPCTICDALLCMSYGSWTTHHFHSIPFHLHIFKTVSSRKGTIAHARSHRISPQATDTRHKTSKKCKKRSSLTISAWIRLTTTLSVMAMYLESLNNHCLLSCNLNMWHELYMWVIILIYNYITIMSCQSR